MTDSKKPSKTGTGLRSVFKTDGRGSDDRRGEADRREQLRLADVRRTPKDRRKKAGWNGSDA